MLGVPVLASFALGFFPVFPFSAAGASFLASVVTVAILATAKLNPNTPVPD